MIRLALYIHNHQPVGNFDEVFEYAYSHSYLPLLRALMRHKGIKFGIHNSGPLLEWLSKKHPEYLAMVKEVVRTNQAEILSSVFSEPILSLIPRQDAVDQIKYFNDYIYKNFEYQPKGLWLTERVWEPGMVSLLINGGIEYTLLDDTHFRYTGLDDEKLNFYYITEDEGRILKVFPISMKLRYLIPFHQVDETIDYLKDEERKKDNILKALGDDGEKFGVWPGTYNWVYGHNWLENFLTRLEQENWIKTVLLYEILKEPPAGRVYLPTASYEEMGEWALPPKAGHEYDELKRQIDRKYFYLIRGGYFKNFLSKYPEANLMQKRMLYVSKNIADNIEAKLALWRGQCSCAYWHGIFGGLYLPHLREAVYRNLIEAESYNLNQEFKFTDFDADGKDELIFSSKDFFTVLRIETASFLEIDDRRRIMNILNYLARREEKYHKKLPSANQTEEVKSIHEIFKSKSADLCKYLIYDKYERGFAIDHNLGTVPTTEDFYRQENLGSVIKYSNYKVFEPNQCHLGFEADGLNLKKTIRISLSERTLEFAYDGDIGLFGVEFSFGIFHSGLKINDKYSLYELQKLENIRTFKIEAENLLPIEVDASEDFTLLTYPIETISSSEAGFERNFQGFSLFLVFKKLANIRIKL